MISHRIQRHILLPFAKLHSYWFTGKVPEVYSTTCQDSKLIVRLKKFPKMNLYFPKISEEHTKISERFRKSPESFTACSTVVFGYRCTCFQSILKRIRSYTNEFCAI